MGGCLYLTNKHSNITFPVLIGGVLISRMIRPSFWISGQQLSASKRHFVSHGCPCSTKCLHAQSAAKAHSYAYWLAAQRITLVNPVSMFYLIFYIGTFWKKFRGIQVGFFMICSRAAPLYSRPPRRPPAPPAPPYSTPPPPGRRPTVRRQPPWQQPPLGGNPP